MRVARVLFFVVAILYFSFHGAKCDINFPLLGADASTYKNFIQVFRQELSIGTQKVFNLTVLKHQVASNNQRFLLVNLFNYNNDKITLGIDVFDVYVVGFLSGTNSYILKDAPNLAYNHSVLFPGSTRQNLSYTGGYGDLPARGNIPLGRGPLDAAITNFFRKDSTSFPRSLVVVIQMVSEAARFNILESKIAQYLNDETTFKPDNAFQSLENNWGRLSKQVQKARGHNGQFPSPVELTSSSGKPLIISNVSDPFVQRGIALLKYTSETSVDIDNGNDNIDEVSEMHHVM